MTDRPLCARHTRLARRDAFCRLCSRRTKPTDNGGQVSGERSPSSRECGASGAARRVSAGACQPRLPVRPQPATQDGDTRGAAPRDRRVGRLSSRDLALVVASHEDDALVEPAPGDRPSTAPFAVAWLGAALGLFAHSRPRFVNTAAGARIAPIGRAPRLAHSPLAQLRAPRNAPSHANEPAQQAAPLETSEGHRDSSSSADSAEPLPPPSSPRLRSARR